MTTLQGFIRRRPVLFTVVVLLVFLFVVLPVIGLVVHGLISGSGQVSY
jgi:ABC-type Fe3+ transport system permease subunit